ncbi:MAG TPA: acyltransferase [Chitinophagaceae bacterium]|nr:acyltransferase [Chitinophagaceae bacterium]
MQNIPLATKPHYPVLDGLRGVASVVVIAFHIMEAHSNGSHIQQVINHGYLAVDFFFVLSGFVVGYAYDDRWNKMSISGFFKIRLVRLQPMVILGSVIGAALFYWQNYPVVFPNIPQTPVWQVIVTMLIGCTLIPVPITFDIRGWQEMHPLNGPAWSLFFEYIANILYAVIVRRFSKLALAVLVFLSACFLFQLAVTSPNGDIIGGWSVTGEQLHIGFARLLYPFFAGLLLYRLGRLAHIKNAFTWCSLLVVIALAMPRVGGTGHLWANGLYDALTVIIIFPLIIYLGASGQIKSRRAARFCDFLGDISYPLYITHYPLIYIYTGWVATHNLTIGQAYPQALLVFFGSILLAYACLKLYDEPVRKWLKIKVLAGR